MTISAGIRQKAKQMLQDRVKQEAIAAELGVSTGWVSGFKKSLNAQKQAGGK
jgi:predicted transcriptional regulator